MSNSEVDSGTPEYDLTQGLLNMKTMRNRFCHHLAIVIQRIRSLHMVLTKMVVV